MDGTGTKGPGVTRRAALRGVFAVGAVGGTAAAWLPIVGDDTPDDPKPVAQGPAAERFSETYRGRRIRGSAGPSPRTGPRDGMTTAATGMPEVTVDDVPLHVMRRADGTYLSEITHYESFPTLREAARAAVDELGSVRLSATHHTI